MAKFFGVMMPATMEVSFARGAMLLLDCMVFTASDDDEVHHDRDACTAEVGDTSKIVVARRNTTTSSL